MGVGYYLVFMKLFTVCDKDNKHIHYTHCVNIHFVDKLPSQGRSELTENPRLYRKHGTVKIPGWKKNAENA